MFISVTRLRVRSVLYAPQFFFYAVRSAGQVKRATGFLAGELLGDRDRTFWTMTSWDSQANMRRYMTGGPHRKAMPHLLHWCDEASVVHWEQQDTTLPSWIDADRRMREDGRASKVRNPSPQHATLTYAAPRTSGSRKIVRAT